MAERRAGGDHSLLMVEEVDGEASSLGIQQTRRWVAVLVFRAESSLLHATLLCSSPRRTARCWICEVVVVMMRSSTTPLGRIKLVGAATDLSSRLARGCEATAGMREKPASRLDFLQLCADDLTPSSLEPAVLVNLPALPSATSRGCAKSLQSRPCTYSVSGAESLLFGTCFDKTGAVGSFPRLQYCIQGYCHVGHLLHTARHTSAGRTLERAVWGEYSTVEGRGNHHHHGGGGSTTRPEIGTETGLCCCGELIILGIVAVICLLYHHHCAPSWQQARVSMEQAGLAALQLFHAIPSVQLDMYAVAVRAKSQQAHSTPTDTYMYTSRDTIAIQRARYRPPQSCLAINQVCPYVSYIQAAAATKQIPRGTDCSQATTT
ncbi:hypothetical protein CERZMDRAFT_82366 [Cercospora zeae-maydis SCOH1-5]|uniref:Uncharacterized protein n=1 Tax=Cercospora zeae-maydis SCOH1-5 TaxID=717836 RepID=A0A6A6FQ60_9PEZI|nr:hypothetical protein CERZMDRAFT_82366 [Cercospora zeae-maydis SCOH1-5]